MPPLSDRHHDAFDNPAKMDCRAGNTLPVHVSRTLVYQINPKTRGLEDGDTQKWLVVFAGERQRSAGNPSVDFDGAQANWQLLHGAMRDEGFSL